MDEEQTYLDPADYPFADFRDPPVQVVDYQGEYGSGQSLAMKELVEIADRMGMIRFVSNNGPDYPVTLPMVENLYGYPVQQLLLNFRQGQTPLSNGEYYRRVYNSAPTSSGWSSYVDDDSSQEGTFSGYFETYYGSLLKTSWATAGYVFSQKYDDRTARESGVRCFDTDEPLWHAPIGAMKTDIDSVKHIFSYRDGFTINYYEDGHPVYGDSKGFFRIEDGNKIYMGAEALWVHKRWKWTNGAWEREEGYEYRDQATGHNGVIELLDDGEWVYNGVRYWDKVASVTVWWSSIVYITRWRSQGDDIPDERYTYYWLKDVSADTDGVSCWDYLYNSLSSLEQALSPVGTGVEEGEIQTAELSIRSYGTIGAILNLM